MLKHLIFAAAVLVALPAAACGAAPSAGPAPAPQSAPPAEPERRPVPAGDPERIGFIYHGAHGVGRTEWWIDASGKGEYSSAGQRNRPDAEGAFEAGPEGFAQVRDLVAELEGVVELPCEREITDQPMGALSWTRGGRSVNLGLDSGCTSPASGAAQGKAAAAGALIRGWAGVEG